MDCPAPASLDTPAALTTDWPADKTVYYADQVLPNTPAGLL